MDGKVSISSRMKLAQTSHTDKIQSQERENFMDAKELNLKLSDHLKDPIKLIPNQNDMDLEMDTARKKKRGRTRNDRYNGIQ